MAYDPKVYYQKNKERERKRALAHYYANKERHHATSEQRRQDSQYDIKILVSNMVSYSKSAAKRRGIEFKLTKEDLLDLMIASNGKCALSGVELHTSFNSPNKVSIDRIDSNKGYVIGNVQLVATCINRAKSDLQQEQFLAMCKAVVDFNS